MSLGKRLKWARERAGLRSQYALAVAAGVSQPAISKIERDGVSTSRLTFAIAKVCQVNARWLATGEGDVDANEQTGSGAPSQQTPVLEPVSPSELDVAMYEIRNMLLSAERAGVPILRSQRTLVEVMKGITEAAREFRCPAHAEQD